MASERRFIVFNRFYNRLQWQHVFRSYGAAQWQTLHDEEVDCEEDLEIYELLAPIDSNVIKEPPFNPETDAESIYD